MLGAKSGSVKENVQLVNMAPRFQADRFFSSHPGSNIAGLADDVVPGANRVARLRGQAPANVSQALLFCLVMPVTLSAPVPVLFTVKLWVGEVEPLLILPATPALSGPRRVALRALT